jgi:hypothetical protein
MCARDEQRVLLRLELCRKYSLPQLSRNFRQARKLSPLVHFEMGCLKLRRSVRHLQTHTKARRLHFSKPQSNTHTICDIDRPRRHSLSRDHISNPPQHNVDAYHISPCGLLRFPTSPTIAAIRSRCHCWHARIAAHTFAQSQRFGPIRQSWSSEQGTRRDRDIRAAPSIRQRWICGREPAALRASVRLPDWRWQKGRRLSRAHKSIGERTATRPE